MSTWATSLLIAELRLLSRLFRSLALRAPLYKARAGMMATGTVAGAVTSDTRAMVIGTMIETIGETTGAMIGATFVETFR